MDAFTVRRYDAADADRVWDVHERAFRASPLPFVEDAPADRDLRAIRERYLDRGGEFLVGEVDGTVVATAGFQPVDGDQPEDAVEIRRMRVHPDYQRRGYARRLLGELETRAREREFGWAVLETNECLTAARRLYEADGYEEVGRERHPATGDEFVRYRKPL